MSDPVLGHHVTDPPASVGSSRPNGGGHDGEDLWLAHLWQASFFFALTVKQGAIYSILLLTKLRLREVKLLPIVQDKRRCSPEELSPPNSSAQVSPRLPVGGT